MRGLGLFVLAALAAMPGGAGGAAHYLFEWDDRGDRGRVELLVEGDRVRIDQPARKFAAIYDRATGVVTGVEVRDGTWWQFVWPELRDRVRRSTMPAERLKDLSVSGAASLDFERPAEAKEEAGVRPILWRPAGDKRTLAGMPCELWQGEAPGGEVLDAWVTAEAVPGLREGAALAAEAGEPLDLVVMRPVLPREFAEALGSLEKARMTPVQVEWGERGNRSRFTFLRAATKVASPQSFAPPRAYRKTSLREVEMLEATGNEKEKPTPSGVRGLQPVRRPEIGEDGFVPQMPP